MTRILAVGLAWIGSAALAGPPAEVALIPVSVHPPVLTDPPAVLLDGTTVPACPTTCDVPCPPASRPPLFARRTAEPKTVCCESPPALDAVLNRVLPVTPCRPPVCTDSCGDRSCGSRDFHDWTSRTTWSSPTSGPSCTARESCEKTTPCTGRSTGGCWDKLRAWLSYRSCPSTLPCLQPSPYQPSVFAYVPCKELTAVGGCGSGCSTGCRTPGSGGGASSRFTTNSAGCSTGGGVGPRCAGGTSGIGLFDRITGSFGFGTRQCTGDGSHRISQAGRHCHLVRDCTGAAEVAGTQLTPGFRFAGAEQIRLYGTGLPTSQPHWPVGLSEPLKPAEEKPRVDAPMPKPVEVPMDPKKSGSPTAAKPTVISPAGFAIDRPFTRP